MLLFITLSSISDFIISHAANAHWIILSLLVLAGFNVPISEDLMVVITAILASSVIPQNTVILFTCMYVGCYFGDIMAYTSGRFFGPKVSQNRYGKLLFSHKRIKLAEHFYAKHGFGALIIGRFIPFGVRNAFFFSAGLGKMPFGKFLLCDSLACLLTNTTVFSISYFMGKNFDAIFSKIRQFNVVLLALFIVTVIGVIWYYKFKKKPKFPFPW